MASTVSDLFDMEAANGIASAATSPPNATPDGILLGGDQLTRDGFDLIWRQSFLQQQMIGIEEDIARIEQNANLSDTEKMFSMQMAMNTWSAVTNLRTNMLKSVSDSLKTIVRNVA
ncbi:MAG: EscF/YscF/HrpA family type III secretion system needle major subunit [Pseudomonadota bacterium]